MIIEIICLGEVNYSLAAGKFITYLLFCLVQNSTLRKDSYLKQVLHLFSQRSSQTFFFFFKNSKSACTRPRFNSYSPQLQVFFDMLNGRILRKNCSVFYFVMSWQQISFQDLLERRV
ncbi:unnamed protein product [Rangifer tarandus platyrhynchus]|uniref:Uncharacterized protein n=2 Tax=Rangifer tarandus platyrhynchus TaxID=3082113 RepID=A0ABN8YYP3_RANTA|nr:unnamed protein product [Rangifer tarandus platyrhynchus]